MSKAKLTPVCPLCGNKAKRADDQWGVQHVCCGLRSRGFKPLVDRATLTARRNAHFIFDPLWQSGKFTRKNAYRILAQAMNMTADNCHMSQLTEPQLRKVMEIARELRKRHGP